MEWPADQVERRPLAALIPSARNARTHSEEQIAQIAASIREWGWTMPILVDEAGTIIAGHGRVLAAARLGLDAVPVMVARGWSEAQKRAYLIADNKLGLNAGWNEELLRIEIADLMTMGFELPLMGFSERELSALNASGNPGLTDPDEAPDAPAVPVTRPGDVWTLGHHHLLCGDATSETDVAACLGPVRPQLMVTDPPYGVAYDPKWRAYADVNKNRGKLGKVANDNRADWREAWALFPGDVVYCWHAGKYASTVQASLEAAGFEVRAQIVWAKDRFALSRGHYHWQHEPCWYAARQGPANWTGDRRQSTVWQIPAREGPGFEHGTQKPIECMKRPIENNSAPGQAVYEPFSGSGTTIIAAEMTGRACHAIELLGQYVDVAVQRWQDFTGETAVLEGQDRTFEAVAAERQPDRLAEASKGAVARINRTHPSAGRSRPWRPTASPKPTLLALSGSIPRHCASGTRTNSSSEGSRPMPRWRASCSTPPKTAMSRPRFSGSRRGRAGMSRRPS
jgi:DNA modification methylase